MLSRRAVEADKIGTEVSRDVEDQTEAGSGPKHSRTREAGRLGDRSIMLVCGKLRKSSGF
jgi:hypothetical protein